jgi:hypothetical protein
MLMGIGPLSQKIIHYALDEQTYENLFKQQL